MDKHIVRIFKNMIVKYMYDWLCRLQNSSSVEYYYKQIELSWLETVSASSIDIYIYNILWLQNSLTL